VVFHDHDEKEASIFGLTNKGIQLA
jgi:hypothetical protein